MTLTPTTKLLLMTMAVATSLALLVWSAVKVDALALNLNEHIYNIVLIVIVSLDTMMTGVLGYLGLRSPLAKEEE